MPGGRGKRRALPVRGAAERVHSRATDRHRRAGARLPWAFPTGLVRVASSPRSRVSPPIDLVFEVRASAYLCTVSESHARSPSSGRAHTRPPHLLLARKIRMRQATPRGILLAGKTQPIGEAAKEGNDDSGDRRYGGRRWHDHAAVARRRQRGAHTCAPGFPFFSAGPTGFGYLG